MRRMPVLGLLAGFALLVTSAASAQCYFCYEGGCYEDIYGVTICLPRSGGSCTLGPPCGLGGCFLAGAAVATEDGPLPIETIDVGDKVLSLDDAGELVPARVTERFRTLGGDYLLINGHIRVTRKHPFRVQGVWLEAGDLRVGDELVGVDGSTELVSSIEEVRFGVRLYNIEVEGTHTFFVDGVLVHNKEPDPQG